MNKYEDVKIMLKKAHEANKKSDIYLNIVKKHCK